MVWDDEGRPFHTSTDRTQFGWSSAVQDGQRVANVMTGVRRRWGWLVEEQLWRRAADPKAAGHAGARAACPPSLAEWRAARRQACGASTVEDTLAQDVPWVTNQCLDDNFTFTLGRLRAALMLFISLYLHCRCRIPSNPDKDQTGCTGDMLGVTVYLRELLVLLTPEKCRTILDWSRRAAGQRLLEHGELQSLTGLLQYGTIVRKPVALHLRAVYRLLHAPPSWKYHEGIAGLSLERKDPHDWLRNVFLATASMVVRTYIKEGKCGY